MRSLSLAQASQRGGWKQGQTSRKKMRNDAFSSSAASCWNMRTCGMMLTEKLKT